MIRASTLQFFRKILRFLLIIFALFIFNKANAVTTTICYNNGTANNPIWNCQVVHFPCSQIGFWYRPGMTCSEQYFAVPPIITTTMSGNASINNNGSITQIGSDKLHQLLSKTDSSLSTDELKKLLAVFYKTDDGKVSKQRLEAIAKELGAKIITVDKLPVANYCPPCEIKNSNTQLVTGKQTPNTSFGEKINQDNPSNNIVLSIGAGITNLSSVLKTNTNTGNLTNFNLNAYIPVLNYGGATGGIVNFGFNIGTEYFIGNKVYNTNAYTAYNINGQTGTPLISAKGTGSPKTQGFKMEGGLQANFDIGSFTISPIINTAYVNLKQKAFTIMQSSSVNGQNRDYNLYSQAETKMNRVAVIPKLQLKYKFGRDNRFDIYTEANYVFGPTVENNATIFKPNGTPDFRTGTYTLDQMSTGSNLVQSSATKYNALGLNFGVSIALGRIGIKTPKNDNEQQVFLSKKGYDSYRTSALTAILFSFDKEQKIGFDVLGSKPLLLRNYNKTPDQDLKAIYVEPIMISFETKNIELRKRLETDSIIISYSLKQDEEGKLYAIPFPIIGKARQNKQMQACDNCNGCDEGGCGGTKFCYVLLPTDKSKLSASAIRNESIDSSITHQIAERKIYSKLTKLGSYTYQTIYNGEPVNIKIEYDPKIIQNTTPQNRPAGKWCGCCIGSFCWAWFTTDLNLDCAEMCRKLNKVYTDAKN